MSNKQWIPLESNPEVLSKFGLALGISPTLSFSDVWSLDLLDMVPSPRYAVLLLFPLTEKITAAETRSDISNYELDPTKQPYFCRQTIGNACGTIALLHAAINSNAPIAPLTEGSFLDRFKRLTEDMSPSERATALQEDVSLEEVHQHFAQEGQTAAPAADDKVDMHFVSFVEHNGLLYELDGRKEAPVKHGPSKTETLLQDAAKVIKDKFMALDQSEHRFTIMALTME